MINPMMICFMVAAFVAGSFVASPELRAYASMIANDVICSGCVGMTDLAGNAVTAAKIKDGEVKAAEISSNAVGSSEIAANAVGASEIAGVSKLIFAQCDVDDTEGQINLVPRQSLGLTCPVEGAFNGDNVIATFKQVPSCIDIEAAEAYEDTVTVVVQNDCTIDAVVGVRSEISLIVFDK